MEKVEISNGISNLVSGVGTAGAKSLHKVWVSTPKDNAELWRLYSESWIASRGVTIPVQDALRAFRCDAQGRLYDVDKKFDTKKAIEDALIFMRVFGGAAIIAWSKDDMKTAWSEGSTTTFLQPMASSALSIDDTKVSTDQQSEWFGLPEVFTVNTTKGQMEIHISRVFLLPGNHRFKMQANFWPSSILLRARDEVLSAHTTLSIAEDAFAELRIDTFKIPGLMARCADDEGTKNMLQRFAVNQQVRSLYNAQLLDSEEEYLPHETRMMGVADIITAKLEVVSSAFSIPVSKFLGVSSKGLNATGEGDSRDYYQMVDTIVDDHILRYTEWLDVMLEPVEGWQINPVRVASPFEQAKIDNQVVDSAIKARNLLPPEVCIRYILSSSNFSVTEAESAILTAEADPDIMDELLKLPDPNEEPIAKSPGVRDV